jgi:hypothetical protein
MVTAGIGGLPDTILDSATVVSRERRARHERQEPIEGRCLSPVEIVEYLRSLPTRTRRSPAADDAADWEVVEVDLVGAR